MLEPAPRLQATNRALRRLGISIPSSLEPLPSKDMKMMLRTDAQVACQAQTKAGMFTAADCSNVKPNFCKTPCCLLLFSVHTFSFSKELKPVSIFLLQCHKKRFLRSCCTVYLQLPKLQTEFFY